MPRFWPSGYIRSFSIEDVVSLPNYYIYLKRMIGGRYRSRKVRKPCNLSSSLRKNNSWVDEFGRSAELNNRRCPYGV